MHFAGIFGGIKNAAVKQWNVFSIEYYTHSKYSRILLLSREIQTGTTEIVILQACVTKC